MRCMLGFHLYRCIVTSCAAVPWHAPCGLIFMCSSLQQRTDADDIISCLVTSMSTCALWYFYSCKTTGDQDKQVATLMLCLAKQRILKVWSYHQPVRTVYHRFCSFIMLRDDFTSRMAGLVHYVYTCSQKAIILAACLNKSGGSATDSLSYMAQTPGGLSKTFMTPWPSSRHPCYLIYPSSLFYLIINTRVQYNDYHSLHTPSNPLYLTFRIVIS